MFHNTQPHIFSGNRFLILTCKKRKGEKKEENVSDISERSCFERERGDGHGKLHDDARKSTRAMRDRAISTEKTLREQRNDKMTEGLKNTQGGRRRKFEVSS